MLTILSYILQSFWLKYYKYIQVENAWSLVLNFKSTSKPINKTYYMMQENQKILLNVLKRACNHIWFLLKLELFS